MTTWITDRLPTAADADLHGLVRWSPDHPGLLIPWHDVRPGERWQHSSAWRPTGSHRSASVDREPDHSHRSS